MADLRDDLRDDLRRLHHHKSQTPPAALPLGPEMVEFFKQSVARRQTKLAKLAEAWERLVPPSLNDHCSLEGFSKGVLTVIVDTASHMYEMKQLLLGGIQDQMLMACRGAGLRKITLKSGRWYEGDQPGERRVRFPSA